MVNKLQLNVDLKSSTPLTSKEGNHIFAEAFILRKVSKFLAGTEKDAIIPIPIFYDVVTGKILLEMLPPDLREEYKEIGC